MHTLIVQGRAGGGGAKVPTPPACTSGSVRLMASPAQPRLAAAHERSHSVLLKRLTGKAGWARRAGSGQPPGSSGMRGLAAPGTGASSHQPACLHLTRLTEQSLRVASRQSGSPAACCRGTALPAALALGLVQQRPPACGGRGPVAAPASCRRSCGSKPTTCQPTTTYLHARQPAGRHWKSQPTAAAAACTDRHSRGLHPMLRHSSCKPACTAVLPCLVSSAHHRQQAAAAQPAVLGLPQLVHDAANYMGQLLASGQSRLQAIRGPCAISSPGPSSRCCSPSRSAGPRLR